MFRLGTISTASTVSSSQLNGTEGSSSSKKLVLLLELALSSTINFFILAKTAPDTVSVEYLSSQYCRNKERERASVGREERGAVRES